MTKLQAGIYLEQSLLSGSKHRGVGDSSGQKSHHISKGDVRSPVYYEGHSGACNQKQQCQKIEFDSSLLERGEEAGAHLHAKCVDEQDKSEVLDDVEHIRIDLQA